VDRWWIEGETLVYEGPGLARRMADGLAAVLERDGFRNIAEAVGSE